MDTVELKAIIEALLFAAPGPVRLEQLALAADADPARVAPLLAELETEYLRAGRGFVLVELAEGYQLRTRPEHAEWVRRLHSSRPTRLSRAALEALAIIAYQQPVTRADIDYLRGVDSGGVVKSLLDKRLVRIVGKKDVPGRPLLYGTSREFLEFFGLRSLSDLPTLKEFTELTKESESLLFDFDAGAGGATASSEQA
ncbi:chromosome segregation and condensation protein ScpB [Syntrophotalea carbinolica DSM 2380]|uniref:Segregation and condensation protein B n=1 Tax=Syntrophotalea carbinolica (strain DSM 2380 / NBRC 103641 / GraBd1) TaxID=338963 RepID=SCPB_SYNC1|nr:RecName: Full=Segregation and condensation protein B [Syntrophotalea carbinolica DSM 2380]ABA88549.2 chromosome segregation and condensation protein ScpB [Syntrophotalea carbinolica DSM 2380]